jgi:NTE family protein
MFTAWQWFLSIVFAGRGRKEKYLYLLDRGPLRRLLEKYIHTEDIRYSVDQGHLEALCITASGFTSNQSVSFFHANNDKQPWTRFQRIGIRSEITVDHLMASSAIPFVFAPQKINREHFGDGSMRQIAPISPALHLGADKVLVIGNRMEWDKDTDRVKEEGEPTIGEMAGYALDSIFLDSLVADIERLTRINKTISVIPEKYRRKYELQLRHIDVLVIYPSQDMGELAADYVDELPWTIRFLLGGIGGIRGKESNLISYLLFERGYCRRLIELGYQDAMKKKSEILEFLDLS